MTTSTNPVLEEAIRLIDLGYEVFPCGRPDDAKAPLTPRGCKDASRDPDVVERWFGGATPPNLAVSCSGLFVIDVDPVDGRPNPWPEEPAWEMDLGLQPTARTPRGGRHHWFGDPNREFNPSASRLAPGVDVRAGTSYVLVYPSRTPDGEYSWLSELDAGPAELTPVPEWVRGELVTPGDIGDRLTEQEWLDLVVAGAPQGRRNDTMARLVGKWISMGHEPEEVLALALQQNRRNRPPLSDDEVRKVIRSVHRTHRRKQAEGADPETERALETLRRSGVDLPEQVIRKAKAVSRKVAEERTSAKRHKSVSAMDSKAATEFLAQEFSWLPEPLTGVEQTTSKSGFETFWLVFGSCHRVVLGGVKTILTPGRVNEALATEFKEPLPPNMRKKGEWDIISRALLRAAVVLDPEFDPETEVIEWLRDYCDSCQRDGGEWERMHKAGMPYIVDGELRVQAYRFASWLRSARDIVITRQRMCEHLARVGMRRRTIVVRDPTDHGRQVCRSYCCGPASILGDGG